MGSSKGGPEKTGQSIRELDVVAVYKYLCGMFSCKLMRALNGN